MADTNVAQDQIKAYVDRILRMKDEADAIASDVKEIYAEAKANGFDKTQLGNLVTYLRKKDKDADKVAEGEAIFDLYLTAYMGAAGKVGTKRATHTHASEDADDEQEPQPTKAAGRDQAASPALSGQVADIPDIAIPISNEAPMAVDGDSAEVATAPLSESVDILPGGNTAETLDGADQPPAAPIPDADKSVEAPASAAPASIYPAPGEVYWENTPRKPVHRHEYSVAFGDLGQDHHVIAEDISKAQAAPIVMIGDTILDGWARYNCARCTVGLDGQTTYYPAVQYGGTDPLIDCIRWNMEGRILNESQRRLIAKRLVALEPKRKADIFKALDMGMELVA